MCPCRAHFEDERSSLGDLSSSKNRRVADFSRDEMCPLGHISARKIAV